MTKISTLKRRSGILAHITSLPSPYGIGDMGPGTEDFLQFLNRAEQAIWQILPLGPTDPAFSNSPYMSVSAFAGNPLLISPELLFEDGLLQKKDILPLRPHSPFTVDFKKIIDEKQKLLKIAFTNFAPASHDAFHGFVNDSSWLTDYCLFMALKLTNPGKAWFQWDQDLIHRDPEAISAASKTLHSELSFYQFEQYIFFRQWQKVLNTAHQNGIQIFGDIPIYVSLDSADVWSNQEIFDLHPQKKLPIHVAGVPPDYFSKTGQKWGNPLYLWNSGDENIEKQLTQWWVNRFQHVFKHVDIARIDHFRGFESYWSVPANHKTALQGKWVEGPGGDFFSKIFEQLGRLNIVAEDLGEITDKVIDLRDSFNFPGMRILQFAFDNNPENSYLPYNFETPNTYVYTGTHDNNTTVGWYLDQRLDDNLRSTIKKIANRDIHDKHGIHNDLIYLAMSSIASVCIIPLQDVLGFGSDCRMNTPGTTEGNWLWRCSDEFITERLADELKELTLRFGRERIPSLKQSDRD